MSESVEELLGIEPEGSGEFDNSKPEIQTKFRSDRDGLEKFADPQRMIRWMNQTRRMPIEAIDDFHVNETYPAAIWLFRQAAVCGDLKATQALKLWLEWAKPILHKKKPEKAPEHSKGSAAFAPREPEPSPAGEDD